MSETEVIDKLFLELSQFTKATTANELRLLDVIEQIGDLVLVPGNWEPHEDITHRGIIAAIKELMERIDDLSEEIYECENNPDFSGHSYPPEEGTE